MKVEEIEYILSKTAEHFGITTIELRGQCRKRQNLYPRYHCIRLLRDTTQLSLVDIGYYFYGRHYSTILSSLRTHSDLCETDSFFSQIYEKYFLYYLNVIQNGVQTKFEYFTKQEIKQEIKKLIQLDEQIERLRKQRNFIYNQILRS